MRSKYKASNMTDTEASENVAAARARGERNMVSASNTDISMTV